MNRHMNLEYLNTFVTAAETGKLNLTAELIFRTPSAVSVQIKKLEEQFETELFVRGKNALLLTGDGEILYKYAKHILKLSEEAFYTLKDKHWNGNVVLGMPTDYAESFLTDVYPDLKKNMDACRFHIICSRSRAIRRSVEMGNISAAVVAMEPQYQDDLPLWEEPLYWACAKGYEIPQNAPLPIALFSDDCIVNTYTLYSLKHFSMDYEIVFTSTMSENIEEAVRTGLAVSLLPATSITDDMDLLPETFLTCPFILKVGFIRSDRLDNELGDRIYTIVKNGFGKSKYGIRW